MTIQIDRLKALRDITRTGNQARRDGYGLRDNPYEKATAERAEWQFGWLMADMELCQKIRAYAEANRIDEGVNALMQLIEPLLRDLVTKDSHR